MQHDGQQPVVDPYGLGSGSNYYGAIGDGYDEQREHHGPYGGAIMKLGAKPSFLRAQRRRMNILAILLSLFIPWFCFALVCACMSFEIRYKRPILAYGIVWAVFFAICYFAYQAWNAIWEKRHLMYHEPTWWIFIFLTSLFCWLAGYMVGNYIYLGGQGGFAAMLCFDGSINGNFFGKWLPSSWFMGGGGGFGIGGLGGFGGSGGWGGSSAYYRSLEMSIYTDVDPLRVRGQQIMDAAAITFINSSHVDQSHIMGFRNKDMFCVAPIISNLLPPPGEPMPTYDFWAIGTNCCDYPSDTTRSFRCGAVGKENATSGIRLFNDYSHPFYRLAVQQAEAVYHIRAAHPLFFEWVEDSLVKEWASRDGQNGVESSGSTSGSGGTSGSGSGSTGGSTSGGDASTGGSTGTGGSSGTSSSGSSGTGLGYPYQMAIQTYLMGIFMAFILQLLLVLLAMSCFSQLGKDVGV